MDGLIGVDKRSGLTSHDVVARVRRITGERTAGHTGTLDPWATGVLVVCMGKATRLSRFLMESPKSYDAEIVFGESTDTGDAHGYVVASDDSFSLSKEQVFAALARFAGDIMQVPPMVSAVHHQGRRLYDIAREGVVVAREARPVTIYEISPVEPDAWPESIRRGSVARIAVTCSKGTYIRTLCEDICASLGIPGHMGQLRRTMASGFDIGECVSLERIAVAAADDDYSGVLHPMCRAVKHMPSLALGGDERHAAAHGSQITVHPGRINGGGRAGTAGTAGSVGSIRSAGPAGVESPDSAAWVALLGDGGELVALARVAGEAGGAVSLQPKVVLAEEA